LLAYFLPLGVDFFHKSVQDIFNDPGQTPRNERARIWRPE
jgi:hypothetical protein